MPEFIAKVGTSDGVVMERTFTAESEAALRSDLVGRDYLVFTVRRKSGWLDLLPGFGMKHGVRMKEFLLFNQELAALIDRKSTRLNSSHGYISYAVFCLKKKKKNK